MWCKRWSCNRRRDDAVPRSPFPRRCCHLHDRGVRGRGSRARPFYFRMCLKTFFFLQWSHMNQLLQTTILKAADELCPIRSTGRPRTSHRDLLESFMTVLSTGMQWRALTRIDFRTAHRHFTQWARRGVFELAYHRLHRLKSRKTRSGDFVAIDTTFIKSIYGRDTIGPNPTDRGRMATKMIAAVDGSGLPIQLAFFKANVSDHTALQRILPLKGCKTTTRVYADKGFDSKAARRALRVTGCAPRVARRRRTTPLWHEIQRRVVERFFSWLDKSRRLIVRYDFTIQSYAAWTWLACARLASRR